MDKTRDKLVSYAANLNYADLTPNAIHAVKRSMVDSVGCAIGSFNSGTMKTVRRFASQYSAKRPATIIGTQIKSSPELAAFANGSMIRYSDFSDDYFGGNGDTGPHPSDNIGSLLAATEWIGGGGKSLALGAVIAYEISGQLIDHTTIRGNGWDHPTLHAISTSLGASKILELTPEQMAHALGLAVVSNVCMFQTRLGGISNWKGLAGPSASRNGLFAALIAKEGITGPGEPFEGKNGFMKQLNNKFELGAFGGGKLPFKVEGTYFKHFPVVYQLGLPVSVALELRTKVKIEDIESICVYFQKKQVVERSEHPEQWDPKTRESADHSGPYVIGAALVDGGITEKTFTPERYRDPTILNLIEKIRFAEDPQYSAEYPRTFNCRFEAALKSGETITVYQKNPKGHPGNPMSDQEIEAKFLKQVGEAIDQKQARVLLDQLWELEKLDDISKLFPLMLVRERD